MHEGEIIKINKRFYKLEECQLQRAYQTCGKHLWFMVHIVCRTVQIGKKEQNHRFRRALNKFLLSEVCCHNVCTVSEITRYCSN